MSRVRRSDQTLFTAIARMIPKRTDVISIFCLQTSE
jgi:hypothetical protein